MGPGGFFPTNPDLADILGDTDFNFDMFYFLLFSGFQISRLPGSKILDFQISGFPDSQISTWPAGRGRGTAPRQLRTTKLVRSKELGQYRENPISASPVWGTWIFKSSTSYTYGHVQEPLSLGTCAKGYAPKIWSPKNVNKARKSKMKMDASCPKCQKGFNELGQKHIDPLWGYC